MESSLGGHSKKLASSATQSFEVKFWFYLLGTFGSLLLWWSWNPNQTSNDWVVPTLTLEASFVLWHPMQFSKIQIIATSSKCVWMVKSNSILDLQWLSCTYLDSRGCFVQWPPRLFSIKSWKLVPNVPEWWSWNPNQTSNDWVAPGWLWRPVLYYDLIKSKKLDPKCASMVKLES